MSSEKKRKDVPWLRRLQRHPFPVAARFRHSLVLTYALPEELLAPLLPPGLVLDVFKGFGFVAIALVQTESLRPLFLPRFLGQDFFLSGYRIFARYRNTAGRTLRGLRILRSDTNMNFMRIAGNLLTHYNYGKAAVALRENDHEWEIDIQTPNAEADLHVVAELNETPAPLPEHSPFADLHEARLFAGPLPFTFDYESESHSIILIEGLRTNWLPHPVKVEVKRNTFFHHAPFNRFTPILANAFHVQNISYQWKRGIREPLPL